jgi:hypothetical protein
MLSQTIWCVSVALEVFLLGRGLQAKLVSRYPAFYGYVAFVLFQDLPRFLAYRRSSPVYSYTYFVTEFLCLAIGCVVVFEVYRVGLSSYPGAARMARNVLALVFALALAKAIANVWGNWWLEASTMEIERDLRTVQALAILGLVSLFLVYAIPFGKNLRGILLGYGLFVAVRVISLIFFVPVLGRRVFWDYVYSASYLLALGIWLTHLWAYSENPATQPSAGRLESDYLRLAAATRRRLQAARGQLAKAVRS